MYNVMVVSHGDLAEQMLRTGEMILGKQEAVESLCLKQGESKESFEKRFEEKLNSFRGGDVLVLADIYGGTPFNTAMAQILKGGHNISLLSGVNLPMFIQAAMNKDSDIGEVISEIKSVAIEAIKNAVEALSSCAEE